MLAINIIHNTAFEYGMIGLAFIIGSLALSHGFRRHHHRLWPWLLFTMGMLFLIAKQLWPPYEFRMLPFAFILIVLAHIQNYRLCRVSGHPAAPSPGSA